MAASMISVILPRFSNYFLNSVPKLPKINYGISFFGGNNSTTKRFYSESNADKQSKPPPAPEQLRHYPGKFDKFLLVWTKKYPSIKDVPEFVTRETMDKAKDKARVYTNLLAIGVTIVACVVMVITGKAKAKSGDTLQKRNLDWHKQMAEQK